VRCRKADLQEYASTAILAYLARPDLHRQLARGDERAGGELARVREDLATARHELGLLRAEVGAGRLSVASLVGAEPGILVWIAALEAEESRLATPSVVHGLITPGQEVAARWEPRSPPAARSPARCWPRASSASCPSTAARPAPAATTSGSPNASAGTTTPRPP